MISLIETSLQLTPLRRSHRSQSKDNPEAITTSLQELRISGIHAWNEKRAAQTNAPIHVL